MNVILKKIGELGIIPVIKIENVEDSLPICQALKEGGLPIAEITFRTQAADEAIKIIRSAMPEVLLGAGTVLTVEQIEKAMDAGAQFIVTPGCNKEVIRYCVQNKITITPGCCNPTDIETAISFGLDVVKFFPAESYGGLGTIKALSAPYSNIRFIPTGGINEKNIGDYLAYPEVLACGGSFMVKDEWIRNKDFYRITEATKQAVSQMLGFDLAHVGIHSATTDEARTTVKAFHDILDFPLKEGKASTFIGQAFEVCHSRIYGALAHIAIKTKSIERAVVFLTDKGIQFNESSAKYNDGKLTAIYFNDLVEGFAIHLVQNA